MLYGSEASRHEIVLLMSFNECIPLPTLQVTLHAHSIQETGTISRLVSLLNAKTGEASKQRPRCLLKVHGERRWD